MNKNNYRISVCRLIILVASIIGCTVQTQELIDAKTPKTTELEPTTIPTETPTVEPTPTSTQNDVELVTDCIDLGNLEEVNLQADYLKRSFPIDDKGDVKYPTFTEDGWNWVDKGEISINIKMLDKVNESTRFTINDRIFSISQDTPIYLGFISKGYRYLLRYFPAEDVFVDCQPSEIGCCYPYFIDPNMEVVNGVATPLAKYKETDWCLKKDYIGSMKDIYCQIFGLCEETEELGTKCLKFTGLSGIEYFWDPADGCPVIKMEGKIEH